MFAILRKIFSSYLNILAAILVAVTTAVLMLIVPQFSVLSGLVRLFSIFQSEFWLSLGSFFITSLSVMSVLELIIFTCLVLGFGINALVFIVYVKHYKKRVLGSGAPLSFAGILIGVFGAGCLSCSVILLAPIASILGIGAATWVAGHGALISFIGLIFVSYSIYMLLKKLRDPNVCELVLTQ